MELNTRLNTYGFMRAAAACLPGSDTFGDTALIRPTCAHFPIPVEDAEHTVFVQQLKRKAKANKTLNEKKETPVEVPDACPGDIFPNMNNLLTLHHDDKYCGGTIFSCQSDKNRHQGNNVDR